MTIIEVLEKKKAKIKEDIEAYKEAMDREEGKLELIDELIAEVEEEENEEEEVEDEEEEAEAEIYAVDPNDVNGNLHQL